MTSHSVRPDDGRCGVSESLFHALPRMLDRAYLRLWWWAEERALDRMAKRWPSEYEAYRRGEQNRVDFLTDAYEHLVYSPERRLAEPGEDYARRHYGETL